MWMSVCPERMVKGKEVRRALPTNGRGRLGMGTVRVSRKDVVEKVRGGDSGRRLEEPRVYLEPAKLKPVMHGKPIPGFH